MFKRNSLVGVSIFKQPTQKTSKSSACFSLTEIHFSLSTHTHSLCLSLSRSLVIVCKFALINSFVGRGRRVRGGRRGWLAIVSHDGWMNIDDRHVENISPSEREKSEKKVKVSCRRHQSVASMENDNRKKWKEMRINTSCVSFGYTSRVCESTVSLSARLSCLAWYIYWMNIK